MTVQFPDRLIHNGREYDLCACPLDAYIERLPLSRRPCFVAESTALWRGYVATWEIRDSRLWLVELDGWVKDGPDRVRKVDLASAFPWRKPPILAKWVHHELRCPEGRLRWYVHHAFGSHYERDRYFWVENGEVKEEWLVFNPPSPLCYLLHPDGTRTRYETRSGRDEDKAPDPFAPGEPVEPWKLWGQRDWDIHASQVDGEGGYFIGGLTTLLGPERPVDKPEENGSGSRTT